MTNTTIKTEDEYNKFIRVLNFRLPPSFKLIGLIGAVSIFVFLLASKFIGSYSLITKDILRTLVLLFMLVASVSKDPIEDEYNRLLRFQSYVISFVFTALYTISIPLIAIFFDFIITKITGDGTVSFHQVSAFEVLFLLMGLQLLLFSSLKRFCHV